MVSARDPGPYASSLSTEATMLSYLHPCPWSHVPQFPMKPPRVLPPGPLPRLCLITPRGWQRPMATHCLYFLYLLPHFLSSQLAMSCCLCLCSNNKVKPAVCLKTDPLSVPTASGPGFRVHTIPTARSSPHWPLCPEPEPNHSSLYPNGQPRWQGSPYLTRPCATRCPGGVYLPGMDRKCRLHWSLIS